MTTPGAASYVKVGIMTTIGYKRINYITYLLLTKIRSTI